MVESGRKGFKGLLVKVNVKNITSLISNTRAGFILGDYIKLPISIEKPEGKISLFFYKPAIKEVSYSPEVKDILAKISVLLEKLAISNQGKERTSLHKQIIALGEQLPETKNE